MVLRRVQAFAAAVKTFPTEIFPNEPFVDLKIHHSPFNLVSPETLRAAQEYP
jgi:hypothetical protein